MMRPAVAALVSLLAGAACMGIELTAVRLLAPYFGDSAYVWTNVIGVILLALAVGAYTGGRLAERAAGSPLALLLLAAAALTVGAPLLGPVVGPWLLPQDLPLDAAMPALVRGSLAATILLFAPAVWLLGAVTPGLVVACVRGGHPTGRAAGAIGACGTLGSLLGTFAATHWAVPTIGCRATLWSCAAILALAAALCGPRRRALAALVCVGAVGGAAFGPAGPLRAALPPDRLLAERESPYQYLQIVGATDDQGHERRELKINEGLDSFHSLVVVGRALTSDPKHDGVPWSYFDYDALAPFLAGDGKRPVGLRALSIGDAAGTFRRVYAGVHPGAVVDGVELDPDAVLLGERWFPGATATGRVISGLDGRVFVARATDAWHVIHVDAYGHQIAIPPHLASREFFAAVKARLLPGGVVACNVGGVEPTDPVVQAIGGTMAAVFGSAAAMHVPGSRNFLLAARRDRALDPGSLQRIDVGDHGLTPADAITWRAVVTAAQQEPWTVMTPAKEPLVDDRPVLDQLIFASYLAIADDPTPIAIGGRTSAVDAEQRAYDANRRGDADATIAAVQASERETAFLRYLGGRARWQRRELGGAAAEFEAALRLDPDATLRQSLQRDLDSLQEQIAPVAAAAAIARRNGQVALGAAAVLLLLAGATYRMSRMPAAPSVTVSTAAR